ncbi:hypothetical protein H8D57_02525 [bacterium]|nr:hypothetical protein [bacterium]
MKENSKNYFQRKFNKKIKLYKRRGISGLGKSIAEAELKGAALLWRSMFATDAGLTLDIGTGNGQFWERVIPPDDLILMDISDFKDCHRYSFGCIIADAEVLPIKPSTINRVVSLGLIEYLPKLKPVFSSWREIVQDRGRMLFSNSPPKLQNYLRNLSGIRVFPRTDQEVKEILGVTNWKILNDKPILVGWQSLYAVEAV